MIFNTLTSRQTNIWIKNIEKVIALRELLAEKNKDREVIRDNEYKEKYLTGWRRFFHEKECYTRYYTGDIFEINSFFFKLKKMTPYNHYELHNMYQTEDYLDKHRRKYKMMHERWTKYAHKPFQIEEKDVIFYQEMKEYHADALIIAKGLKLDYEAFNLDEDCEDRG